MGNHSWKVFKEYTQICKDDLSQTDWLELKEYVKVLQDCCKKHFDVEERPFTTDQIIELKSFVGSYGFASGNGLTIRYKNEKLNDNEFAIIGRQIAEWGIMLGSPFLKSILKICSPLTENYEIILAYSDLLRRYTEAALDEYIPPVIEKHEFRAEIPLGKINVPKTISLMATGQMLYVSQRIKANIVNLPLLLMVRFHSELLKELSSIEKIFEKDGSIPSVQPTRAISRCKKYHRVFLTFDLHQRLLAYSYEIDFGSCEILDKVRRQASTSPSISDI